MKAKESIPVTAVFDIGKTNKKFFLFDEDYSVIQKQQTTFDQTEDEDGDPCENLKLLEYWVENKLRDALQDKQVQIKSLNFSTHGASFVHLNEEGDVATPLYNYLKPHPEELFNTFSISTGAKKNFACKPLHPRWGC